MVVTAGDLALGEQGFESDASDAIPLDDFSLIPPTDDGAAPIGSDGDEGAASPETLDEFDLDSLPDPHKQHLESHFRSLLEREFEQRRSEFQSIKDRELATERARAQDAIEARARVYAQYLKEMGVEQRDIESLEFRVNQEFRKRSQFRNQQAQQAAQVQQQQTEAVAEFQTWQSTITSEMQEYARTVGVKPDHPAIMERFQEVLDAAEVWNETQSPAALKHYQLLKDRHKNWVTKIGTDIQKRKEAQPSSEALNRQRARGPQNLSAGSGGGSGPMSLTQHVEAVRAEVTQSGKKVPYEQIYNTARQRYYQQNQPR